MCHGSRLSRFDWGWETSHLYIIGILKWVYKPLLLGWWVYPLLYGNNGSLDPGTYHYPTLRNGSSKEPWEEKTRWFWGGYSWWRPKKVSCQSHLLNGYAPPKKNASAATLHETNIIPNWWIFAKHQFSILTALIIWWTTSSPVRTIKRLSRKKKKTYLWMFTRPTSARFWAKRKLFSNSLTALSNKSIQLALVPGIYISHRIHVWQNVGHFLHFLHHQKSLQNSKLPGPTRGTWERIAHAPAASSRPEKFRKKLPPKTTLPETNSEWKPLKIGRNDPKRKGAFSIPTIHFQVLQSC